MKLGSHTELLNNEHCFCLQRLLEKFSVWSPWDGTAGH